MKNRFRVVRSEVGPNQYKYGVYAVRYDDGIELESETPLMLEGMDKTELIEDIIALEGAIDSPMLDMEDLE